MPGPVLLSVNTVVNHTSYLSSKNSLDIRNHDPGGTSDGVLGCNPGQQRKQPEG